MKKKFSTKWKASRQVRKQRKYRVNAPLHIKHKFMSANLSKELRKKYGKRSFPLRKGDEVKIMRGSFKGKKGKIISMNNMKSRVSVEGIQRQKKDGTKINVNFNASKLQIIELNLEDKERINALERGKKEDEQKKQTEGTDKTKKSNAEPNMKVEKKEELTKNKQDKKSTNKQGEKNAPEKN